MRICKFMLFLANGGKFRAESVQIDSFSVCGVIFEKSRKFTSGRGLCANEHYYYRRAGNTIVYKLMRTFLEITTMLRL